ncbi:HAD family hydrolase [Sphaerisporangium sp. NPDC051017]|uniref:HAD family hydrolase n=1 Tax=Sphaerisporangium sp. NPDC051017 TaxID=3154636 RepID=UPI003420F0EB
MIRCIAFDFGGTLAPRHSKAVDPDAIVVLSLLRSRGYRLVLASNTQPHRDRRAALVQAGVDGLFAELIQSHQLGFAKPQPQFYKAVEEAATVDSPGQILFVGNNITKDVAKPLEYGMRAVLIRSEPLAPCERLPAGALLISTVHELPGLLDHLETGC